MASEKEITSTEKLLGVIRGGAAPEADVGDTAARSGRTGRFTRPIGQKGVSVGVDIGYSMVRIVTVSQTGQKRWRLLTHAAVPIPEGTSRGTPEFTAFLKDILKRYCGYPGKKQFWAMMSSASVEVRNISVPRVGRNELENTILWSARKEFAFDEKEVVFDYEVQGTIVESGVEKYSVLFYAVPRKDVEETKDLFAAAGYSPTGLTIAPLALQNIFRTDWVPALDRTVASLYIGRGWSRIDIFSGGNLVMTRGIKAGLNSMAESLVDEYNVWRKQAGREESPRAGVDAPGDAVLELGRADMASTSGLDIEQARMLMLSLGSDSKPAREHAEALGLDSETIFTFITPALERLVRQVERTFEHYAVHMGRESISALYLSAAMDVYRPMAEYVGGQLDIPCDVLDPLDPSHEWVGGQTAGESLFERAALGPVLGTALSHPSRTMNLIYTREDWNERKRYLFANYVVLALIAVLFAGSVGWYAWLGSVRSGKEARVAALQAVVDPGARINEARISAMAAGLREAHRDAVEIRERYLAAAVFGEVSLLTPEAIRLVSVRTVLGKPGGDGKKAPGTMMIDGYVTGTPEALDETLIAFVMDMQSSPLFSRVIINGKTAEKLQGRDVLRFTLTASMEALSS